MLSTVSQLVRRSAIGSTFAWTSSRLRKPAAKDKQTSKHKNIFQVVMTPDCSPKFSNPSLDVAHVDFDLKPVKLPEDLYLRGRLYDVKNSKCPSVHCNSESSMKEKSMKKKETRYKKDSLFLAEGLVDCKDGHRAMHHRDLATRAALSLPHLLKITTLNGFLVPGESPNVRMKESLFFESDTAGRGTLGSRRKEKIGLHSYPLNLLGRSGDQGSHSQNPGFSLKQSRTRSLELMGHSPLASLTHCPVVFENYHSKEEKSFRRLMMKHLPSIKHV